MSGNFSHRRLRRSRKDRKCNYCNGLIQAFQYYICYRGRYEGNWDTDQRHTTCAPEYIIAKKCARCQGGLNMPDLEGLPTCVCASGPAEPGWDKEKV